MSLKMFWDAAIAMGGAANFKVGYKQGWIPNQNLTGTPSPTVPSPSLPFLSLPSPPLRSRPP